MRRRAATYAAERDRLAHQQAAAVRRAPPARKLLTPGPQTAQLLHPIGPEVPGDRHVQQVIDLCIRIGEVLLSSGEGSGETTETMLRVADAFGLSAVDVDVTFTADHDLLPPRDGGDADHVDAAGDPPRRWT